MKVNVDATDLDNDTEPHDELFSESTHLEYRDCRAQGDTPALVHRDAAKCAVLRLMVDAGALTGRRRLTSLSLAPSRMSGSDWRQTARRRPATSAAASASRFEVVRPHFSIGRRAV